MSFTSNAESNYALQARVEEGFRTIADTINLSGRNRPQADIPLHVQNWLSNQLNGKWAMILDSADDDKVFYGVREVDDKRRILATYLPDSSYGSIVITTRNKALAFKLTGNYQNIIENKLGPSLDAGMAVDLVEALDRVPLALRQAAAYIQARKPRSSIAKYLAESRQSERKKTRLLEHNAGDLRRGGAASNAVLTTWQISFDYIRDKQPSAADLSDQRSESCDGGSGSDTDSDADGEFEDDVTMLRNYCLVSVNDKGDEFEMHGLVQSFRELQHRR
ncbi:hypothetical protein ACRALDRAFT_2044371 [Sodiomyces alcalophilus JCM 7366]|uniref:uncharacterized protein n=1 Tax=Sodiomyces alcalophilus JCM 7366 TaxID=591952 RepID=UPI0039B6365B